MQKPLPRQTPRALNPPAAVLTPYTFFENATGHPLDPLDTGLSLRNAWWLCDAALLAYSAEGAVNAAFTTAGIEGEVAHFRGMHSTQAYVTSMPEALVLAFRGTQVDDFWSSVLDFTVDARFLPVPDSRGDFVHAGFLAALREVWPQTLAHLRDEQARRRRPLWITGHSLGAALATLAASLCQDDPALRLQGVYTFGSPRVGDEAFRDRMRVPVFRFRNDSDIVPHLPLGLLFRHVGSLQFIDGAGHLHRNLTSAREVLLDPGAHLLSARDAMTLRGVMHTEGDVDLPLPGFLADHAPINYSVLLWNCYETSQDER
jgi:triacylglycerol lipase